MTKNQNVLKWVEEMKALTQGCMDRWQRGAAQGAS